MIDKSYDGSIGDIPRHYIEHDPEKTNIIEKKGNNYILEATQQDYNGNILNTFQIEGKLRTQKINYLPSTLAWAAKLATEMPKNKM